MNIRHSKIKNTGILFELLVRQITSDTLSGKESKAINILKKYFVKSELGKEYKLYETLSKQAEIVINSIVETSKGLNRGAIKRQKYNLIKEISTHYNIEDFFKTKLPNYKLHASLYTLLELYNTNINNPDQLIENKINILESLTSKSIDKQKIKDDVLVEFQSYDKDLRILTYRVLLEKFNEKYSSLNGDQKIILKEFVNSVDSTPKLRDFYNTKIGELKTKLTTLSPKVADKAVQIKLDEVIKLLTPLSKSHKVNDDNLINLLQYYELLNEIKNIHGKV